MGIYVVQEHKEIFSGGFPVMSNGDNFHAEVVGVTVAVWAAVDAESCTVYTDSLATIQERAARLEAGSGGFKNSWKKIHK